MTAATRSHDIVPHGDPQSPRMRLMLMLASLLGVVTFFVPFAHDVSPLMGIHDADLWRLAVPFAMPVFATMAFLRWSMAGRLAAWERTTLYTVAAGTGLITLSN